MIPVNVRCATSIVRVGVMPQPKTDATHYHVQLGLPQKKVVQSKSWLSIGCYLTLYPRCMEIKREIWHTLVILGCWTWDVTVSVTATSPVCYKIKVIPKNLYLTKPNLKLSSIIFFPGATYIKNYSKFKISFSIKN